MLKWVSNVILILSALVGFELLAPGGHATVRIIVDAAAQPMPAEMPPEKYGAEKAKKPQSTKSAPPAATESRKDRREMMPPPDVPDGSPKAHRPATKQREPAADQERNR